MSHPSDPETTLPADDDAAAEDGGTPADRIDDPATLVPAGGTAVVAFTSDACAIWDKLAAVFAEVAVDAGAFHVTVDADEHPLIADQFGVKVLPAFAVFVDGRHTQVRTGAVSREDLTAMCSSGAVARRRKPR